MSALIARLCLSQSSLSSVHPSVLWIPLVRGQCELIVITFFFFCSLSSKPELRCECAAGFKATAVTWSCFSINKTSCSVLLPGYEKRWVGVFLLRCWCYLKVITTTCYFTPCFDSHRFFKKSTSVAIWHITNHSRNKSSQVHFRPFGEQLHNSSSPFSFAAVFGVKSYILFRWEVKKGMGNYRLSGATGICQGWQIPMNSSPDTDNSQSLTPKRKTRAH